MYKNTPFPRLLLTLGMSMCWNPHIDYAGGHNKGQGFHDTHVGGAILLWGLLGTPPELPRVHKMTISWRKPCPCTRNLVHDEIVAVGTGNHWADGQGLQRIIGRGSVHLCDRARTCDQENQQYPGPPLDGLEVVDWVAFIMVARFR